MHVNGFNLTGINDFVEEALDIVDKELMVSKIEQDRFRFTGLDISAVDDGIEVEMSDYINSLKDIKEIEKVERDEDLTKNKIKEYQKATEKNKLVSEQHTS